MNYSSIELHAFWDRFLKTIEDHVNAQSFRTWFKPLTIVSLDDDTLVIAIPKPYYSSWLEEHYMPLIKSSCQTILNRDPAISFVVTNPDDTSPDITLYSPEEPPSDMIKPGYQFLEPLTVNPRFTFENFVVGNSNQFAYAASKSVAEAPGRTAFNPLVLYSGVGLGKTHILQAITNYCINSDNLKKDIKSVIYVSSEKFTMDFILSIQNKITPQYSHYYRQADLLLVDDIQFFNNKERTQEEFFHIFNTLHQNGKQIVLTMDRPPSQLTGLADRLINRFQWGLVTDIQPPDFETRVAILKNKAEGDGVYLDNSIAEFIAHLITTNIRELEGSLIRLLAYASLHGEDISLDMVRKVLNDTIPTRSKIITIETIQKLIAEHFSISDDILISDSRMKEVAIARHISIYLCKQLTDSSLKTIGLHFGGRDHSTVIHSLRTVEKRYMKDPSLMRTIQNLIEKAKNS